MTPEIQAIALHASATRQAITILVNCLLNNGALRPGQFAAALKSTFNDAEALTGIVSTMSISGSLL